MAFIKRDQPGNFQLGPLLLEIPPENIQISRYENQQMLQYLRHEHSVKIPSGRAAVRVDINFKLVLKDDFTDLKTLQQLIGMTRVTPFIPVTNQYLAEHLPFYSSELVKDGISLADSIPMAIFGMSLVVGGDSPELVEIAMSLLFWNPMPFTGAEAMAWTSAGKSAILTDIEAWIELNITGKKTLQLPIPTDAKKFALRWWDLMTYSQLTRAYPQLQTISAKNAQTKDVIPNEAQSLDNAQDYYPDLETDLQKKAAAILALRNSSKPRSSDNEPFNALNRSFALSPRMAQWDSKIVSSAQKWGVDAELMRRMIDTESRGKADAFNKRTSAAGLAQFIPQTAASYGIDDPFNPDQSINGMGHMLSDLSQIYHGDVAKMLAGYNWGSGNLRSIGNDVSKAPTETKNYIARITGSRPNAKILAAGGGGDPVEQSIKEYYNKKGGATPLADGLKTIRQYWHNGILPNDPELRKFLAQEYGVVSAPGIGDRGFDSNPVYQTSYGKSYGKTPVPFIDPEVVAKLATMGWYRVSDDIRPLDPLFEQRGAPNVIDMTPDINPTAQKNQVVTALSMSFQNRFVLMPVTGWPYPTIQHMGAFDSDIRVGITLLADDQHFPIFRELNRMSHIMDTRSIDLRSSVFNGRDVFAITKIACENRILNGIGITHAVLTDLQAMRDPESPDVVRLELGMTENGMVDEELFGHFSKSDAIWKGSLLAWLEDAEVWKDTPLGPYAKKIKQLSDTATEAYAENKKAIDGAIGGVLDKDAAQLLGFINSSLQKREVEFNAPLSASAMDRGAHPVAAVREINGVNYRNVPMKVAPAATPDLGRYKTFLTGTPDDYLKKPGTFNVPIDPELLKTKSPLEWSEVVWRKLFGGLAIDDPTYYRGMAERYLDGPYGSQILEAIGALAYVDSDKSKDPLGDRADAAHMRATLTWLSVWNKAHYDWYKRVIILDMLNNLSRDFPDAFQNMKTEIAKDQDRKPGCYRDLGLANDVTKNPYEWIDVQLGPQIKNAMEQLADRASVLASGCIEYARTIVPHYEAGMASRAEWNSLVAKYNKDHSALVMTPESFQGKYEKGVDSAFSAAPTSINQTLDAVRRISPVQFTVRRAFPAFKLYFVEEENVGTVKSFDEFYSYNAILDWNLIEQVNQGSTLVVTISNIFNHLDALVLNETLNMQGLDKLGLEAIRQGQQPIRQNKASDGSMTDVGVDGRAQALQNIALRPGTKIVLKVGYNNDPGKLETLFTGQVTEVQSGDIMTLVAQGWESELFGTWDPEVDYPFSYFWLRAPLSSIEEDPQGTSGATRMLKAILRHPQCKHFGHFQIGSANPFDIYTWSYTENKVARQNATGTDKAGDRSGSNIRPGITPFYDVFGLHPEVEQTKADGRVLWDIIQELRLSHPNNICFVRPYGNGDATIYFGPPNGTYTSTDLSDNRGLFNDNALKDLRKEAFAQLINREEKVLMNRVDWSPGDPYVDGLDHDVTPPEGWVRSFVGWATHDTGITLKPIPVWALLADPRFTSMLFNSTSNPDKFRSDYLAIAQTSNPKAVETKTFGNQLTDYVDPRNNFGDTTHRDAMFKDQILKANGQSGEKAIDLYFAAIDEAKFVGIVDGDDIDSWKIFSGKKPIRAAQLNYVLKLIEQEVIRLLFVMRDKAEATGDRDTFSKLRVLDVLLKDVRKWHIVTSKHHIIANNIEINSDFANKVRYGKEELVYDPGLEDVRMRDYSNEGGDKNQPSKGVHGYIAANLLAQEMRKMYRGEIILTGNPMIRPHDVLVIIDEVRQIFGIVEVDKVVNSMTMDTGYISVVTPALMVEVGDMTMAHAYQAFYSALTRDIHELHDKNGELGAAIATALAFTQAPTTLGNIDDFTARANGAIEGTTDIEGGGRTVGLTAMTVGGGSAVAGGAAWVGGVYTVGLSSVSQATIAGAVAGEVIPTVTAVGAAVISAPLAPLFFAVAGAAVIFGGYKYVSWLNQSLKDQFKQHPLTITPLVKRSLPWVAGIDGAAGRTAVGQWGVNIVKGWRDYGKLVDVSAQMLNVYTDGVNGQKTYENVVENKPTTGP